MTEILGGVVWQDPQEMVWIESQAALFFIIILGLILSWFLKEAYIIWALERGEKLVREAMISLFSLDDDARTKGHCLDVKSRIS